jgi:hypothetical protein
MKEEYGFFVEYGDGFYSQSYEKLSDARNDAKSHSTKKLRIFHGKLKRQNDNIIDDRQLSLVPRLGGYEKTNSK